MCLYCIYTFYYYILLEFMVIESSKMKDDCVIIVGNETIWELLLVKEFALYLSICMYICFVLSNDI